MHGGRASISKERTDSLERTNSSFHSRNIAGVEVHRGTKLSTRRSSNLRLIVEHPSRQAFGRHDRLLLLETRLLSPGNVIASNESSPRSTKREFCGFVSGVCSNATAPSVSSINRILRNRAAERAAAEFARAAGYGLYAAGPHPYFNSGHQHPTTSHHLAAAGWPAPGAAAHPWMLPPLATGISGAASALLLPPSLSPGAAAASASAAPDHSLHADAIARGYLQGDCRFHLRERG